MRKSLVNARPAGRAAAQGATMAGIGLTLLAIGLFTAGGVLAGGGLAHWRRSNPAPGGSPPWRPR